MKHKTATLEGALLDAAVAKACGEDVVAPHGMPEYLHWRDRRGERGGHGDRPPDRWHPSTNWDQGGKLMERMVCDVFSVLRDYGRRLDWYCGVQINGERWVSEGRTPLIAAMRAYVASVFGECVEL